MSDRESRLMEKAAELRRAFDHSFAEVPTAERIPSEDYLAIRVGPDPYAVRLAEISGLYADKMVTRIPSRVSELLGVAGSRGTIIAVYDLGALLGCSTGEKLCWLMVACEMPVGLAFSAFEGHLRIAHETGAHTEPAEPNSPYFRGVLSVEKQVRPVVHLAPVLEAIKRRAQAAASQQEE